MTFDVASLLLLQQVRKRDSGDLLCQETRLQLSPDQRHLVLSRYVERYSPQGVRWIERQHRVAVNDLLRWLIAEGEPSTRRLDASS